MRSSALLTLPQNAQQPPQRYRCKRKPLFLRDVRRSSCGESPSTVGQITRGISSGRADDRETTATSPNHHLANGTTRFRMRHKFTCARRGAASYDLPSAVPVSNVALYSGGKFVPPRAKARTRINFPRSGYTPVRGKRAARIGLGRNMSDVAKEKWLRRVTNDETTLRSR